MNKSHITLNGLFDNIYNVLMFTLFIFLSMESTIQIRLKGEGIPDEEAKEYEVTTSLHTDDRLSESFFDASRKYCQSVAIVNEEEKCFYITYCDYIIETTKQLMQILLYEGPDNQEGKPKLFVLCPLAKGEAPRHEPMPPQ